MKHMQQAEVITRLHCAAGHLKAVIKMAEAGQPCEEVLHQLRAVEAALRAAEIKLILCQIQSSQAVILENPSPERRMEELKRIQSLYAIFIHSSEVPHGQNPF